MFQLLDSVDEKICRDLRLSEYHSAADFQSTPKPDWKKANNWLEIIEDLKRIPPLKSHQPKLVQAEVKALNDLTEFESTGDINNPMVIRSIESKLPDDMKIE